MEKYLYAGFEILIKFGYFSKEKFYIFSNAFSLISNVLRHVNTSRKYCQLKCKHNIFKLQSIVIPAKRLLYNDFIFFFFYKICVTQWLAYVWDPKHNDKKIIIVLYLIFFES